MLKGKQLTNIRAAGKDEAVRLTPPIRMTLERALAYIEDDELVESHAEVDSPAENLPRSERAQTRVPVKRERLIPAICLNGAGFSDKIVAWKGKVAARSFPPEAIAPHSFQLASTVFAASSRVRAMTAT